MKKIIVLGMIVLLCGATYMFPKLMINPGELSAVHKKEENKCLSCHEPFWGISNDRCISCHSLSAIDSLKRDSGEVVIKFHEQLHETSCTNCHTDHKGAKGDLTYNHFDHALLQTSVVDKCSGCHARPADDLHLQLNTDCHSCHTTADWKLHKNFDHNNLSVAARNNCVSCHATPSDEFHSTVNNNCSKCHTPEGWTPSRFNHNQYFVLDRNHNVKCSTCHTSKNYKLYTCYTCHEHSESRIREEHIEEGIYNFTNCTSCHKTADEHDARSGNHDDD